MTRKKVDMVHVNNLENRHTYFSIPFLVFFPRGKTFHRIGMSTRKSAVADGVSTERKANVSNYQPLRNILWGIRILGIGESGND